ncbi:MAG TPA: hypothetical protein VFO93_08150 [Hymenobacter sp.]|uniref:hypothetical protein n=1 Tax=Hymenobacter sp. TaxID=1898978 RepID=UPI002D7FC93D|nr:hypothetical protein [Hymenobacter sp.]HET9503498.1 hypothetical protein [Hymenobacter sp.]
MSINLLASIAGYLAVGLVLVAATIGLARYRRLPQAQRYLALLAAFDVVMELTVMTLHRILHLPSNLFLFPLIAIGEVGLLALAYRAALKSATFGRVMPWVVAVFSGYALWTSWVEFHRVHYPTTFQITADLLQFALAALYFWKLLRELHVAHPQRDPFFWVSVGLLVFVLGDLLIMLFSNYLLAHYSVELQRLVLAVVRPCFLLFLYGCYSLALWMRPPKTNSLSS